MREIIVILICGILGGCATPYKKNGLMGGFSETRLQENVFTVRFEGNGYTSSERAKDFVLLRAAEIALENEFKFFSIVDSDSRVSIDYSHVGAPPTSPVRISHTSSIESPESEVTIVCYKDKQQGEYIVYDAKYLGESIMKKYDIK